MIFQQQRSGVSRSWLAWLLALCFVGSRVGGAAQPSEIDWPWLKFTLLTINSDAVTHIGNAGDERLFIGDKAGRIRILEGTTFRATHFLDLSGRIRTSGEGGLWSLAFSPRYAQNGRFYVAYSRKSDGATVVSRLLVSSTDSNMADAATEEILLTTAHSEAFHYGGQLAFGPDGYLYFSCGDATTPANAQQLDTWHGKILRLDPEAVATGYRIPEDNPFARQSGALPEIWALGLRNPWRFSFDRLTGDLYIGDVGESTREEIDFQPASSRGGENYGWPHWEGNFRGNRLPAPSPSTQFVTPAIDYVRGEAFAIIGGVVYRGPDEPRMNGFYFHADVSLGRLWAMKHDGVSWRTEIAAPKTINNAFTTFGEDKDGRLYVSGWDYIYRLEDSMAVAPPRFDASGEDISSWLSDRVRVISRTAGATIHYTTDGSEPTQTDPVLPESGTVTVTNGTLLSARAWRVGLTPSEITRGRVFLTTAPPVFTPLPGEVQPGTTVTISCATPEAVIHYTLDGRDPDASAPTYVGPLLLNDAAKLRAGVHLRARATRPGFVDANADGYYFLPQIATPQIRPSFGAITNGTLVTITCDTPGVVIHYENTNQMPTLSSPVYSQPIPVNGNSWLYAVAFRDGFRDSYVATAYYASAAPDTNVAAIAFAQAEFRVGDDSGTALITVTRSGLTSSSASVDIGTVPSTAVPGTDYIPANGTLRFPPDVRSQTFSLRLLPNARVEADRKVWLWLSNASNAVLGELSQSWLVITNNDFGGTIQFSATNYFVAENRRVAYLLLNRTDGFASDVTVHLLATNGTATSGEDFVAIDTNLTFQVGEKKKLIGIRLLDDLMDESHETISAFIDTPTGGAVLGVRSNTTITLRDNDTAGVIQLAQATYHVSESNASLAVVVTRSGGAASNVTVHLQSFDWTADADDDFERVDTIVRFGPGERSKAVSIAIFDDDVIEPTEVARLKLSEPTGGARLGATTNATLFIADAEISALGTYIVSGAVKVTGCSEGEMNGSPSLQGRVRIDSQTGTNFSGTLMVIVTSGGGYESFSLTGSVNSACQLIGSYRTVTGAITGALTGSIRGEKLQLTLDGDTVGDTCRHHAVLSGTRYIALPDGLASVSVVGRAVDCAVSKASGFFAGLLSYQIDFTSAEECELISGTQQIPPIEDGRYVYWQTGANTATLRLGSQQERSFLFRLTFTSPTNGLFTGTAAGASGSQVGTFAFGH